MKQFVTNPTYSSWRNRRCWHPLLLELWGGQQAVVSSSSLARSVLDTDSLLVALVNPLHLLFRHIEDVCNFSRRLGLEILDDQHFAYKIYNDYIAFIAHSYLIWLIKPFVCLFLLHYGLEIGAMPLQQDFCPAKNWCVDYYQALKCRGKIIQINFRPVVLNLFWMSAHPDIS